MAKPPKDRRPGQSNTFFITASTWQGRALFFSERMAQLFLECLYRYRKQGKYLLHEFVLMPNHFHAIVSPADGITLERAVQFIKGGFSYEVGKQISRSVEIWQRGFVDHRIHNVEDYVRHVEYIHQNPVRAGLVLEADGYRYSSAHPQYETDEVPQRLKPLLVKGLLRHG